MLSATVTFILTVIVGFCVASWFCEGDMGIIAAVAFVGAVIVYKLSSLRRAFDAEKDSEHTDNGERDERDERDEPEVDWTEYFETHDDWKDNAEEENGESEDL